MEYFDWSPKNISINICIFYNFANSIVLWQCSLGHAGKALKIVAYKLKELQRSWLHRPPWGPSNIPRLNLHSEMPLVTFVGHSRRRL